MKLLSRIPGHTQPTVSCAASPIWGSSQVASGSEDARLVIHDLGAAGVTAASSPGATASPCVSYQATLSTDPEACVASIAWHPEHVNLLYASVGSSIVCVDSRVADPVSVLSVNKDEINQVAINHKATYLAAADDAGDIQVVDLGAGGKHFKSLRGAHTNIASGVAFRAHRPWEVLTTGMDMTVARWDFSRGKCLDRWRVGAPSTDPGGSGPDTSENQLFNPPLIHALSVPAVTGRPWCSLAAIARGDGVVSMWDADAGGPGAGVAAQPAPPPTAKPQPGPSKASSKKGGAASKGKGGGAAKVGAGGNGSVGGAAGKESWGGPWDMGRSEGGHTRPASSVCFAWVGAEQGVGCGPTHVVSGGEDRQLFAWRVSAPEGRGFQPEEASTEADEQQQAGAEGSGRKLDTEGEEGGAQGEQGEQGDGGASAVEDENNGGQSSGRDGEAGRRTAATTQPHNLWQWSVKHRFKVNQVSALRCVQAPHTLLVVSDTTKHLAVYRLGDA